MRNLLRLTKPGICFMISGTAAVGYITAAGGLIDVGHFIKTIAATALLAASAAALNQILERKHDAAMKRTCGRPLPSGAVSVRAALALASVLFVSGTALSLAFMPLATTIVLEICFVTYAFIYTTLKRRTPACTLVGAVPGALPVLAGWLATGAAITPTAVALVAVMFLWQMPHFLSIGWVVREDYARAGFRILSVTDVDGSVSARISVIYAALLLPVSIVPFLSGGASLAYCAVALAVSGTFLWYSGRFAVARTPRTARQLFFTSLAYLPVLFSGLLIL